jgi:hypothetical protein
MSKRRLSGVDDILHELKKATDDIEEITMAGLIRAVIVVRRDMDKTSPLIPIDEGNLRASWFVSTSTSEKAPSFGDEGNFKGQDASSMKAQHSSVENAAKSAARAYNYPVVIFGFTANYAAKVHEMVGATFQRPGAGAKFLQASLRRNRQKMVAVIAEESRKALRNK